MKKIIQLGLFCMLIFTGGCGMSKEKENGKTDASTMPETEAIIDEFTREFMASSKEVEERVLYIPIKDKGIYDVVS
ncbi:hypothetical protein M4D55_16175 [Metabacillus idriensis]|uniref:hypothetical protein n=1 Tax=Metabacillus idriensis TaxID=324768 RepID=UPI00174EA48F|nr:hypothetical protein [Metabacillus idriensis]MCM3597310.1 hypothetical protein [Metabacillus idriensis]